MMIETWGAPPPFALSELDRWWLAPRRMFDGTTFHDAPGLLIENGQIATIAPAAAAGRDGAPVWRSDDLLVPGFVDLQINGGGGALYNADPTPEGLAVIARAHRQSGTTALLPTIITDAPEVLDRAVDAMLAAFGRDGIAGIHIEGPHISIEKKGAHNPDFIRPFDQRTMVAVTRLRQAGIPVLLTLAPECVPGGTIAGLVRMGVVVSLGHTAADAATVRLALAEGARSVTHLFNGMTPMSSRAPGVVGAAIDSGAYCGIIADGYHVDDAMFRLACRARPVAGRMVLVSDAMPTWAGPDSFDLYGETIRLEEGRLVNAIGSLAGVHIDMAKSVARIVTEIGLPLDEALRMATSTPAELMGLNGVGVLRPGVALNAVLLDRALDPVTVLARQ